MKTRTLLLFSLGGNAVLLVLTVVGISMWPRVDPEVSSGEASLVAEADQPLDHQDPELSTGVSDLEQLPGPRAETEPIEEPSNFRDLLVELETRDLRIVPRRLLEQIQIPALNSAGQVTDQIRDLLALDGDEEESLNRAIAQIAERLRQVELQNIQINKISDTSATILIPRVAGFAEEIREDLRRAIHRELGDIDGALLWNIMTTEQNVKFWAGFAGRSTEIDVELIPSADGKIAFTAERRPVVERGVSNPSHQHVMYPTEPEDALERLESFLGRQSYMIDHLPEDLRVLLPARH